MAQKVNIVLVDDIDGTDADETVRFGVDGASYEIDLTGKHAAQLREALALYIGHGRKEAGRRARGRGQRAGAGNVSASEVRAWGRENGWEVSERGRVSAELRQAYAAAH